MCAARWMRLPDMPQVLTLPQAAQLLHSHEDTVTEAIRARGLPAAKVGRCWLFIDEDVIAWLRGQYSQARTGDQACGSTDAVRAASGGLTSPSRAGRDLLAALAPQTRPRRRNGPPRLTAITGGSND